MKEGEKEMDDMKKTNHVRYAAHFNERNYEYALHSGKGHFLRNLADVLNVFEYCVLQELKKNGVDGSDNYKIDVIRLVNDKEDEYWTSKDKFMDGVITFIRQMVKDYTQRNS